MRRGNKAIFIIYLIVGIYLMNSGIGLIKIPEFLSFLNKWIVILGGVLVIIAGVRYLRKYRVY